MKKLVPFVLIALVAWLAHGKYEAQRQRDELARLSSDADMDVEEEDDSVEHTSNPMPERSAVEFSCDGRTHCSQMTSCEEAEYFINHCPGTEMDGDSDGVPCERQWCERQR